MSPLPIADALRRIRELAEKEAVEVSRKARTQMDALGYTDCDVCDMLFELEETCCTKVEDGRWTGSTVATFLTNFLSTTREEDDLPPDDLFVEVAINEDSLYVLACKTDGSPQ